MPSSAFDMWQSPNTHKYANVVKIIYIFIQLKLGKVIKITILNILSKVLLESPIKHNKLKIIT